MTKNVKLDRFLGSGAEGAVYKFGNDKIIKIFDPFNSWYSHKRVFKSLYNTPHKGIVKIYDFGKYNDFDYFYVAERLYELNEFEREMIDYLVSVRENNCVVLNKPKRSYYASKNYKLYNFLKNICSTRQKRFNILDIHGDNIMKDKKGNYKVADLGLVRFRRSYLCKKKS